MNAHIVDSKRNDRVIICDHTFCDEPYRLTKKQCAEYIGAPLSMINAAALLHKLRHLKG